MADKVGAKSGSKQNLNESNVPLLEEPENATGKGESQGNEEKIELKGVNDGKETSTEKPEKKKKEKKEKKEKKLPQIVSPTVCAANFTVGLNVIDRDEKHISEQVNVLFEDVLGEPDPTHNFEFVWRLTYLIFNFTRFWLYRLFAAVLAIPLALIWAVFFAIINVKVIWVINPLLRIFEIVLHYVHRVWNGLIRTFLDPFFASAGLLFSHFRNAATLTTSPSSQTQSVHQQTV